MIRLMTMPVSIWDALMAVLHGRERGGQAAGGGHVTGGGAGGGASHTCFAGWVSACRGTQHGSRGACATAAEAHARPFPRLACSSHWRWCWCP